MFNVLAMNLKSFSDALKRKQLLDVGFYLISIEMKRNEPNVS